MTKRKTFYKRNNYLPGNLNKVTSLQLISSSFVSFGKHRHIEFSGQLYKISWFKYTMLSLSNFQHTDIFIQYMIRRKQVLVILRICKLFLSIFDVTLAVLLMVSSHNFLLYTYDNAKENNENVENIKEKYKAIYR